MNEISWGKPRIFLKRTGEGASGSGWKEVPTPVEDSTTLTTTKGDKMEAFIEGGEAEAVKYKKNTYELAYQIRLLADRAMPFADLDGLIQGDWAVAVVPENEGAIGVLIDRSNVSCEDAYTSADGISFTYTHSALKPANGNQTKYGVFTVSGSADNYTLTFKPIDADAAESENVASPVS